MQLGKPEVPHQNIATPVRLVSCPKNPGPRFYSPSTTAAVNISSQNLWAQNSCCRTPANTEISQSPVYVYKACS